LFPFFSTPRKKGDIRDRKRKCRCETKKITRSPAVKEKAKASRGFKTIVAISTFRLWQQMFLENPKKCTEPNLILLLGQLPHTREHCIITFSFGCLQAFDHNVPQHRKSATRSPSCCYG